MDDLNFNTSLGKVLQDLLANKAQIATFQVDCKTGTFGLGIVVTTEKRILEALEHFLIERRDDLAALFSPPPPVLDN